MLEILIIMVFIKKIFKKMQSLNREYLLLFAVITAIGVLIYSETAVSQSPPEEIVLSTIYPAPFGNFNELRSKVFRDFDNPTNRFMDPVGESQVENLRVEQQIVTGYICGPSNNPMYKVDFGTGDTDLVSGLPTSGNATFNVVYSDRFYQDDPGPEGPVVIDGTDKDELRAVGRYVYDIAEGVFAQDCEAGDVVLISDNDTTDVMKSSGCFANRVAGVISENPTIYMGVNKQKVPLALAGIVKCKVSAENGKITKGDLLVTASLPGHAMRAMPHEVSPGMIIGKAMETLTEDTGKILILVNKQ